jgi:hypothetical protein
MSFHLESQNATLNEALYCPHFFLRSILHHLFIITNMMGSKTHLHTIRKKTTFHYECRFDTHNEALYCLWFYLH